MSNQLFDIDIPIDGVGKPIQGDGITLIQIQPQLDFKPYEDAVAYAIRNIPDLPKDIINAKIALAKSSTNPNRKTPCSKLKPTNFLKKTAKKILPKIGAVLLTLSISYGIFSLTPLKDDLKTNKDINDLCNNIKKSFVQSGLGTQNKFAGYVKLTKDVRNIIEKYDLDANDHIQLYVLSLCISNQDWDELLRETGYPGGQIQYYNILGYKDTEDKHAGQFYAEAMSKKLEEKLQNNPEYLRGLYDKFGIYVTESGQVFSTEEHHQTSHSQAPHRR